MANENGTVLVTFQNPYLALFGPEGLIGRSIVIHEKIYEVARFPDVYSAPLPALELKKPAKQMVPLTEEEIVGPALACGVVTIISVMAP